MGKYCLVSIDAATRRETPGGLGCVLPLTLVSSATLALSSRLPPSAPGPHLSSTFSLFSNDHERNSAPRKHPVPRYVLFLRLSISRDGASRPPNHAHFRLQFALQTNTRVKMRPKSSRTHRWRIMCASTHPPHIASSYLMPSSLPSRLT